ncbi:MAG: hypothetical protein AB1568_08095 [Thermodesulfobacteriota bacterium]
MECERLIKLVKSWYLQVKGEALAPARMVSFMEKHVAECPICMVDDEVEAEVNRIARIILPASKIPKIKSAEEEVEEEAVEPEGEAEPAEEDAFEEDEESDEEE